MQGIDYVWSTLTTCAGPEKAIFMLSASWVVACVSMLKVVGSGSMLPQEKFEVYSLRVCFW